MTHRYGAARKYEALRPVLIRRRGSPRPRSTRVKSLRAALDEFLRAPSRDDGLTNEELIVKNLGVRGVDLADPPSFDAVALKYEKPVKTFREAFRACWNGKRDWLAFDIGTLRECDDLGRLQLPEHVEAAIARQVDEAERTAIMSEPTYEYEGIHFGNGEPESPPLEILHRESSRTRKRALTRAQLARAHQRAKAEYHRTAKALRRLGRK